MKKNTLLVTVLVIAMAFTAGCFSSENSSSLSTPTAGTTTALAGAATMPAAAGNPTNAPGLNRAPSAANYSAQVVDVAGTVIAIDNTLTLSGTTLAYNFDITTYNGTQYFVEILHKATAKRVLRRALGILVAPATAGTISGVDCNASTTARAAVIKKIIKKATKTAAETALANASITADTVTTLGASNDVVAQQLSSISNSVAAIKNLVAALRQQVQIFAAGVAAVETDSNKVTALTGTFDISEPEGLQLATLNVVKSVDPLVQVAVTNESANLLDANDAAAPNNLTFITDATGGTTTIAANNTANLGTNVIITSTQVNTVADATTTASATATVPYISSATVNSKTVYSSTTGVAATQDVGANTSGTATIVINFSEAVQFTTGAVIKIRVSESAAGLVTTKTVVYGATPGTSEMSWLQAFGTSTPTLNGTVLTMNAGSGTYKLGYTSSGYQAASFKVELLQMSGVIKSGSTAAPIYLGAPLGTIGYFSMSK